MMCRREAGDEIAGVEDAVCTNILFVRTTLDTLCPKDSRVLNSRGETVIIREKLA